MGANGYGVYIVEPGRVEVREMEVPDPQPGEVQVRCIANGICMAEVSLFRGGTRRPVSCRTRGRRRRDEGRT